MIAKKVCDLYLTDQISKRAPPAEKDDKVQTNQPSKKQLRRERAEQKRLNALNLKKQKTTADVVDPDSTTGADLNSIDDEEEEEEEQEEDGNGIEEVMMEEQGEES